MKEAQNAIVAGAVAGAAIGKGATGAMAASGEVIRTTKKVVDAGDQGWDVDGLYVCSKFLFNWKTREVFDGAETYKASDISHWSYEDGIFKLYKAGRIEPSVIEVGVAERSETIGKLIDDMQAGAEYAPDDKKRLPTYVKRLRRITVGTIFRYFFRSLYMGVFFLGMAIGWIMYGNGMSVEAIILTLWAVVFILSVAWRLFRPIKEPKWSDAG